MDMPNITSHMYATIPLLNKTLYLDMMDSMNTYIFSFESLTTTKLSNISPTLTHPLVLIPFTSTQIHDTIPKQNSPSYYQTITHHPPNTPLNSPNEDTSHISLSSSL